MYTSGGFNAETARRIYSQASNIFKYGSPEWAIKVAKGLKEVGAQVPKWIAAILKVI